MPKDTQATPKVLSHEVVFGGKIWDVVSERFEYNGSELTREFVSHTGGVAVIAINDHQDVLLIRQYRHPVRGYLWEIPAGLLDVPGESRLEAAKRELLEESGYVAESWRQLAEFYTTPGGSNELVTIFIANELRAQGHDFELEGEEVDMELAWVPLSQALNSVLKSEMKSPLSSFAILALAHELGVKADG